MFGFSLTKLIFTVLAGIAVWYGFKLFVRIQEMRKDDAEAGVRMSGGPSSGGKIEDMIKCRVCDAYITADNAVSCGRSDCPYA